MVSESVIHQAVKQRDIDTPSGRVVRAPPEPESGLVHLVHLGVDIAIIIRDEFGVLVINSIDRVFGVSGCRINCLSP